jgi:hypothetical protein
LGVNPVARFEHFVERLMERSLTRATRSKLQPIEIAKRLARVMDADQVVGASGVRVPNIFDVELGQDDYDRFKSISSSVTTEIEAYLARVVRDRHFVLSSSPIVRLKCDSRLRAGEFAVRAHMEDLRRAGASLGATKVGPGENGNPAQHTEALPAISALASAAPRQHASALRAGGKIYPLAGSSVRLGRSADNDLVVEDRRVSRVHAVLRQGGGHWTLSDSGSRNGTMVNGRLISEATLRDGDRISLGGFEMVFAE